MSVLQPLLQIPSGTEAEVPAGLGIVGAPRPHTKFFQFVRTEREMDSEHLRQEGGIPRQKPDETGRDI